MLCFLLTCLVLVCVCRAAELILKYTEKPRAPDKPPDVRWYYGSTGSGKTRAALEEFPDAWVSMPNGRWYDGYDGHRVAVLDDFRKSWCDYPTLLRLLDRYPLRVENKGGSRQWVPDVIIVTCPWAPDVLYGGAYYHDKIGQLTRRIGTVRLFGDVVDPPADVDGPSSAAFVSADVVPAPPPRRR